MMQLAANETQPTATKPTTASNRKQMMRIHLIQSIEAFVLVLLNFNMVFIILLNLIKIIYEVIHIQIQYYSTFSTPR